MPHIRIELLAGRSPEKKGTVVFSDVQPDDWFIGGRAAAQMLER